MDVEKIFPLVEESRTKEQCLKICGHSFGTEMGRNFFFQRVANLWNSPLQKTLEAECLNIFNAELDSFLIHKG